MDEDDDLFHVLLSSHAERQLVDLGEAAADALAEVEELRRDDLPWVAESLPPQQGREVWMLWAGGVRVLFDTEDYDLTIQGFGLRPPPGRRRRRGH